MDGNQEIGNKQKPPHTLPFWRQLRWILIINLILFAIVPLLVMGTVTLNQVDRQVREQVIQQLESVAELKASEIKLWLDTSQSSLKLIVANPTTKIQLFTLLTKVENKQPVTERFSVESLNTLLHQKVVAQPAFEEIFVYTSKGEIVASSQTAQIGKLVITQPYFADSLTTETIQPPYYEVGRDGLTLLITLPLIDQITNQPRGVLAGRLDLTTLGDIMTERTGLGDSGETYLVSLENHYLVTPSRFEAEGYPLNRAYHSVGIDQALQGQNGSGTYLDYRDPPVPVIGVYRWLPRLQAAMLSEVDEAEALALFGQIRNLSLLLTGLTILAAVGVAMYVAGRISKPIVALTEVATKISQGELQEQATVSQSNEIGVLAVAFNTMTSQLRTLIDSLEERVAARTHGLETVAKLSEQLSAILNVNELSATVVNQIQAKFGYYHAHIYLLDGAGEQLVVAEGTGDAGTTMKANRHSIPLDATISLVARAARSGEVVRVDNVRQAPDWLPNDLLPDTYAEMAVPMISEGQVVGVLDVQGNRVGEFDEGDASLLRSLANQVAVAIKNAELYEALAQLNADKDRFFSIVAHDLKGPFQPLLGNAELLMEMADFFSPAEIKEMVGSMHRASKQVLELLENLLHWSRIQMGRMEYQPEHVSLRRLVQETVDFLAVNAIAKEISLVNEIESQTIVYADRNMLNTVIRNLANNSIKFTPQGGRITISATVQEDGSMVEVAVADTGVGISAEDVTKLFQVDVHHSTTGTAKEKGTGLGLILCKGMVEENGGQIWAESEVGQGTTIRFTVPLGQLEEQGEPADEADTDEMAEPLKPTSPTDPHERHLLRPVEIIKMSESVNRSAKAVYDLLDDLHNWVQKQLEWVPYNPGPIQLNWTIEQTLALLEERAERNQINLRSQLSSGLEAYGDEDMLSVVLQGLILNAMRFTPDNGIVMVRTEDNAAYQIEISVSDPGEGKSHIIGSELLNRLDVPQQPVHGKSVGLGLLMYKELVARNQGQIWLESETGQGTTVKFTLPIADEKHET